MTGLRYSVFGDFFAARFAGFAEELVAGTTSAALFLAHRAPTILRAWALRSSGVSFAQRALPPSDWIIFKCSRTVRSFLSLSSISFTAGRECRKYTGISFQHREIMARASVEELTTLFSC
jgi:hypothetical protein